MDKIITRREFAVGTATILGTVAASGAVANAKPVPVNEASFDAYDVPAGEKQFVYKNIASNDAVNIIVPIGVVNGVEDGPTMAITGGLFGTEYSGIEAASRLYRDLDPKTIKGRIIIMPVVNFSAFQFRTPMFKLSAGRNPIDGERVNAVFPGDENGSASEVIAHFVFHNIVNKADYFIDLRGGDLTEKQITYSMFASQGSDRVKRLSREMTLACGLKYYQPRTQKVGSLFGEALKTEIPAIIIQSGIGYKTQPDEKSIEDHIMAVTNIMKHFDMIAGNPLIKEQQHELSPVFVASRTKSSGISQLVSEPGILVKKGQLIGRITALDGSVLEEIVAPVEGVLHTTFVRRVVTQGDIISLTVGL